MVANPYGKRARQFCRRCTDSLVCFLERKYSPGDAIDLYYQYQTMYLRLMAENQLTKETATRTAAIENLSSVSPGNVSNEKLQNGQLTEVNSNQVTAGNRDYYCPRCGNSYTRPHSLNRHMRFECGVEPQFECPICHKKSKHKHNLLLHMRTHQKP
ncbi:longitudinals lacking protein, isoforms A/B/D/L [Monomorium pharaonis]|uniref:longitudinals lacking protein, isoforms A/B/D/L n=1 Tax=Monomorium pharaonis TaxID=307658 RepID=UPI00063F39BB|nr:longitudinals lacking protein, isoforms A/B/D/L [Monomorium pharaonis]